DEAALATVQRAGELLQRDVAAGRALPSAACREHLAPAGPLQPTMELFFQRHAPQGWVGWLRRELHVKRPLPVIHRLPLPCNGVLTHTLCLRRTQSSAAQAHAHTETNRS